MLLVVVSLLPAVGQYNFERNDNIEVFEGAKKLKYPWFGGLNCPQFNTIDLNNDGIEDLVVFNRGSADSELGKNGHKFLTFLNNGTPNQVDYTYAPQYEDWFPGFQQWALLRDFNCDGIKDIITYRIGQAFVYLGSRDADGVLSWELSDSLTYQSSNGLRNIFISSIDIPAIDDIDGDGDLDVLTFKQNGFLLDYFKNQSMETEGNCSGNRVFQLDGDCWGNFWENGLSTALLLDSCGVNKTNDPPPVSGQNRHSGSTILTYDEDGDGDKDLILGSISFPTINRAINGGTPDSAHLIAQDTFFPSYDVPFRLEIFPAAFYEDVDNDGRKDLLVAPNSPKRSENVNCAWWYKDVGTNDTVVFELQTDSFLVDNTIDHGEGAYPAFFDYNGDGKMDLVIGKYGDFQTPNFYKSSLVLYENIGTASVPKFRLVTDDYLNLSSLVVNNATIRGIAPTFGDIDNDGDMDMIIGDETGQLHMYTNTAGAGQTANFTLTHPILAGIDAGSHSTPFLYDVNDDGTLDLLVGRDRGEVHYYENRGTPSNPQFDAIPDNSKFGNIDVGLVGFLGGYSVPYISSLGDPNNLYVLVGTEFGVIETYKLDRTKLYSGAFELYRDKYADIDVGERLTMALADIDGDGKEEMVLGNYRGGVSYYERTDDLVGVSNALQLDNNFQMSLYPNPADNQLAIELASTRKADVTLVVYNLTGKAVITQQVGAVQQATLDISGLPNGLYLVRAQIGNSYTTQKLIVE